MAKKEVSYNINLDSDIAVYVQIENQIQFAIAAGKLSAGDTLPSVRDMSTMLSINPNTVTKAYRDLELMDLVHTRRGVGVTVSEKAPRLCKEKGTSIALDHLREAVAECMACGLSGAELRRVMAETLEAAPSPYEIAGK